MARTIHPIKKAGVKADILAGKSYKRAMLDNGYTEDTANRGKDTGVMREVLNQIKADFKASDITVEYVLQGLKREADSALRSGDRIAALTMLGKYQAMFTERIQADVNVSDRDKSILNRYLSIPSSN